MKRKAKTRIRVSARNLACKALEAEQIAKAARRQQRIAKAKMKEARKSFRHAKRVAKDARKKADAAKRKSQRKL